MKNKSLNVFFSRGRGYPNLTKGVGRRPPPPQTQIFAKLGGWEDYTDLKLNSGTANIQIADGAVPVLGSVVIV